MKEHADHYKQMEIQPWDVMEQRVTRASTDDEDNVIPSKVLLALAVAISYLMRAGLKPGEPWRKDVEKAINLLNRALTGKWKKG